MVKKAILFGAALLILFASAAPLAFAAEAPQAGVEGKMRYFIVTAFSTAFSIAVAAFGGALGQSKGLSSALHGIARNPEASGQITTAMIIGLALIESLVIYALVINLILLFANPFGL